MGHIDVIDERTFENPVLIEGFPGVGLVGKIVADHLVEALEMDHYANIFCDALPSAAAYGGGDRAIRTPVRLYAAPDADLLVLQSDVPVSPAAAEEFAGCIDGWFREESVLPLYIAGLRREGDAADHPSLRGIGVGVGKDVLSQVNIPSPEAPGLVSGPTGALLAHALETNLDAVGLVVDADPQFPDPTAARIVLEGAVEPITELDVDANALDAQASRIQDAKERLAAQMRDADENASQARPLRMYQ